MDVIAAEDTRNSIKLLNHFDIHTPMTSYHEYNKVEKAHQLKEGDKKPIIMNITDGSMELKINSFIGSMNEDIDIEKEGKDILIGFNPKFFIDALRVIDEENVSLYMVNPKAPCFIKDDEGKFIYLILPVNFNNAAN